MGTAALVVITVLLLSIPRKARPATIRKHLLWTFAGRILSMYVNPEECDPYVKTSIWTCRVGTKGTAWELGSPELPPLRHSRIVMNQMRKNLCWERMGFPSLLLKDCI
jgi:hypothetical protein